MAVVMLVLLMGRPVWVTVGFVSYGAGLVAVVASTGSPPPACAVDALPGIILIDTAWIVAMIYFRRLLARYGSEAEQSQAEAAEAQAQVVMMRERERVRLADLDSVMAEIRPLLAGLADGSSSVDDEQVRRACGREETYLRSLIRIDADLGAVADVLVDAVRRAHRRCIAGGAGRALCTRPGRSRSGGDQRGPRGRRFHPHCRTGSHRHSVPRRLARDHDDSGPQNRFTGPSWRAPRRRRPQ